MGLSETILAAMIGAVATVTTALFQIFTAFRARGKVDVKPRKGSTLRSVLAVFALMVASAGGGFLYSEFLKQRKGEDLQAMRQELRELKELTAARLHELTAPPTAVTSPIPPSSAHQVSTNGATGEGGSVESIVYVPACRVGSADTAVSCGESDAQRIALCATIPAFARTRRIDLFAQPDAVQQAWEQHQATLEQDIGGARFTGRTFEYAQGTELKAVCTTFLHWSGDHPHIARIVVHYGFGAASEAPAAAQESGAPEVVSVIAADPQVITSQNASLVTGP